MGPCLRRDDSGGGLTFAQSLIFIRGNGIGLTDRKQGKLNVFGHYSKVSQGKKKAPGLTLELFV